ncbi:type II toxin-antitoxin system PemK/MazF family toxin [Cryobacterium sp. PH31-L1]|uniref:type II toxin-antitoxin system PemK/MazF family toxin n=1 Tax=Cryobacterium sp. PH31-L1 TaxID=3046199 RepID=UPI0024BA3007|nr:type II toxin-antitoxin system PemK/MazF family toxin [Cryobacterium sp. PH31-L1]MDJ0378380.1 type II toxin-antitoxin system PemK/MazF family toxin [Cryobacterium sp. PH31-L1]
MRRGEVRLVSLDPALPGEASKTRPCIVVSNDAANTAASRFGRGSVTIVPLTSSTGLAHPDFQILVDDEVELRQMGLARQSKIQAEQVRTIALSRIGELGGWTPLRVMRQVDDALRFHLSL